MDRFPIDLASGKKKEKKSPVPPKLLSFHCSFLATDAVGSANGVEGPIGDTLLDPNLCDWEVCRRLTNVRTYR